MQFPTNNKPMKHTQNAMKSACSADSWSKKYATIANGFCTHKVPVGVSQPRSIVIRRRISLADDSSNSMDEALVLERGADSILHLQWNMSLPLDKDKIASTRLVMKEGLNHGLAWSSSYVYASTATTVYRWTFKDNQLTDIESVVVNIHEDGKGGAPQGHTTRTLAIDEEEQYLYVSVGSYSNIDESSYRSRIRRFPIGGNQTFPFDFLQGQVFADGLRNEVAMEFDAYGHLWGIGNSGDDLFRADLGGDIHNDNPAEEVHKLALNQHYGYPFCWREYSLEMGLGEGTAWAWPNTIDEVTDKDCREGYDKPVAYLPAHSAPLGLTFYRYNETTACPGVIPFPPELDGFAFIAYHGSWNRDIPTGYKVVYMDLLQNDSAPVDLVRSTGCYAKWKDRTRPVDLAFDKCGRLWVTSDGSRGRGSHLIVVESSSMVLLPQPPTEIPCAWRLPVWAISLIAVTSGILLVGGILWFVKRRNRKYRKTDTSE